MLWKKQTQGIYTKKFSGEKSRYFYATFLVVLFSIAVIGRLFWLQVLKHSYYFGLAQRQQGFVRILEPKRGDIYFKIKTGETVRAAATKVGARVYLNVRALKNPKEIFDKLNQITKIDKALFETIAVKTSDPYEVLKRHVSLEEAEKIISLGLPGVGLEEERWREYFSGLSASHVLGFVSSYEDGAGKYGVERYFESALKGHGGSIKGDLDAAGLIILLTRPIEVGAREGESLFLTLEPNVQKEVEKELSKLREEWHAASGGILIIEPKTGRLRALAAYPSFNPNEYQKEKNLDVFLNPFVEKIFELGSVFKPLTIAAALNEGVITPETTYVDEGEIKIGDRVIKNYDGKARGLRTMTQVLEESLNTGAIFAMRRLGGEKLKEYFVNYGLKEKTGIELPGELNGDLSNLDSGREVEYATASFGQGVAVTPLEFIMAISSLANDGKIMKPIIREDDTEKVIRTAIKQETSETVTRMLIEVVDQALAGGKVKMDHYSIAAKTGTAQIPASRLGGGKGYSNEFIHSFFGYFPAHDPRFLVFIFLERPQGVKYASQSLSDSFKSLVEFLINYYTISPDR